MKNINIKNLKTAKRYAQALLETSKDNIDEINQNMDEIYNLINENSDFKMFFSHPEVSLKDKKEILEEIFLNKINKNTLNFLNVLLDENRFNIFNTIYDVFKKDTQILKNQQTVTVTSAVDLNEDEKERIKQKLFEKTNKEIILTCETNEDILGGLVIKINDKVIDLSLKTKFDNLKKA